MLSMLRAAALAALAVVGAGCQSRPAAPTVSPATVRQAVALDGSFDDWQTAPRLFSTGAPDVGPVTRAWTQGDDAWWYLSLATRDTVNLQAMLGTLHVLVDADDNMRTGGTAYGMAGVDFAIDLSRADKSPPGGNGAGFALRTVGADGLGAARNPYELGVASLPTLSADRFELRLARRGAADGFGRLGPAVKVQLVFVGADSVPRASPAARYAFRTPAASDGAPLATSLPVVAPGSVRIAQWNVSEGSFRTPANHAALLAAVRPDIVLLDEVYEQITDSTLAAFFARPALAALGEWRFVVAKSGGRQRTVVAARNRAIRPAAAMAFVRYEHGALDSLRALVPASAHRLVDIEATAQVSATGAWVDVGGTEVLFVPLDLQSGGNHGNPQDQLRVLQARAIRAHIVAARRAQGLNTRSGAAPVVIAGDFNAVGSFASVAMLQDSLDTDGSALALSHSARLPDHSLFTWQNTDAAQFAPGRLDLTLYPDAFFRQTGGFIFTTEDLSDALLASLGLTRGVFAKTADHLIVVTDLARR
jgi:endonuclease/exonuclease/phosphatase (EEP) superfamily protein YafD